jgi:mRNA interferase MazF
VWWADFGVPHGSAPAFQRPAVVISADSFNRSEIRTVLVAAITSSIRLARRPGNVILPAGVVGLARDSVVNVSQLATVDKDGLIECRGRLGAGFLRQIEAGLRLVLGL